MTRKQQDTIILDRTEDYTGELKKRLAAYGISHGMLARQMGLQESQLSRWFNKPVQPRWTNILKIENAIDELRKQLGKERKKAK